MDKRNVKGLSNERLYSVYNGMIQRCYNRKHPHYDLQVIGGNRGGYLFLYGLGKTDSWYHRKIRILVVSG